MENNEKEHYLHYIETFITENRKNNFLKILGQRTNHFTVAIQDIYQLHNTSAVMRTCDVFGIQNLYVVEEKYGKKIDKEIALGAQKWVDINRFNTVDECIATLKNKGYRIIATTPHDDSCLLNDFDISKPSALFFGTERRGLSQEVLDHADGFLKIPMYGFTESLNISVSAAIILQSLTSSLRESSVKWQLDEKEILEKRIEWTSKSIKDIKLISEKYYHEKTT